MKPKKMIALAALIFALCGCGTSTAASEDNVQSSFSLDRIDSNGVFDLYQDRETGVQYIVYNHATRYGITPRYNADGTLYQDECRARLEAKS